MCVIVMYSGAASALNEQYGAPLWVGAAIIAGICCVTSLFGLKNIVNVISKIGLKGFRVYASGTNLLTFCNKLLKPYDPERNFGWIGGGGGAPIMKTFALGVNINF
jgi:hypothetical protein